jgi:hypothetical protein
MNKMIEGDDLMARGFDFMTSPEIVIRKKKYDERGTKDELNGLNRMILNHIFSSDVICKPSTMGVTILEEDISHCPYRVVTDNEKITNSFWCFYLTPGDQLC